MGRQLDDLTGQVFGKLTVVKKVPSPPLVKGNSHWECNCDCGKTVVVRGSNLRGKTRSCGCLKSALVTAKNTTHGHASKTKGVAVEYTCWIDMRNRCTNPNYSQYADYGGRGITVCDRWLNSYEDFYADMGPKPSPEMSIDRIDFNGNYEPSNCQWATKIQQIRNRRSTFNITHNGVTKSAAEWAEKTGIPEYCLRGRVNNGWPIERVFSEPVVTRSRKDKE